MLKLSILTLNAAIQDLRLFGQSIYCPVPHVAERLAALPEALIEVGADIVCLQEMFHPHLQQQLYQGLRHVYPHAAGFAAPGRRLRLQSEFLVLSRYPLAGSRLHRFQSAALEEWLFTSKGFHEFSVNVPGVGTLELLNVHLTAGGLRAHPQSPSMDRIRERQVRQILEHGVRGRQIMLVGDLNDGPHGSSNAYRRVLEAGFVDTFAQTGGNGSSWDSANPLVAGGRDRHLSSQRIDHVFLSHSLAGRIRPIDSGIVLSGRSVETAGGRIPVSDHYGVLTGLEYDA